MGELLDHINSGRWSELYSHNETYHVLSFSYNLLSWIERDEADSLERNPTAFTWSKGEEIVGRFPITVPEPIPSFIETLLNIFDKDAFVRQYLGVTYDGDRVFRFTRK